MLTVRRNITDICMFHLVSCHLAELMGLWILLFVAPPVYWTVCACQASCEGFLRACRSLGGRGAGLLAGGLVSHSICSSAKYLRRTSCGGMWLQALPVTQMVVSLNKTSSLVTLELSEADSNCEWVRQWHLSQPDGVGASREGFLDDVHLLGKVFQEAKPFIASHQLASASEIQRGLW